MITKATTPQTTNKQALSTERNGGSGPSDNNGTGRKAKVPYEKRTGRETRWRERTRTKGHCPETPEARFLSKLSGCCKYSSHFSCFNEN